MKLYYTASIASFASLLIISHIVSKTGCFKKAVYTFLLAAEGSCLKFYLSILAFTALTVCIFNNLFVVLVFLPVLYETLKDAEFKESQIIAFMYSCMIIGEVSSVCFVNSNINNLIYSEKYHINYDQFASNMFPAGFIGIIISMLLLYILFRSDLVVNPGTVKLKNPDDMIKDWSLYNAEIAVLFAVITGCFLSSFLKYNFAIVNIAGAVILYILYLSKGYEKSKPGVNKNVLILFLLGFAALNIIINLNFKNDHIYYTGNISSNIAASYADGIELLYGFIQMIFSWFINNITVAIEGTYLFDKIIESNIIKEQIIYLNLLFCNVGSIISPVGSISTIIFLKHMKKVDLKIKLSEYIKLSLKTVLPALCAMILIFYIFN